MYKNTTLEQWTAFLNLPPALPMVQFRQIDITGRNLSDYIPFPLEAQEVLYYFLHICSKKIFLTKLI